MSIRICGYGNYSSGNYGTNAMLVHVGDVTLYFSYQTLVAFDAPDFGSVVCKNSWGPTTGKHLNWIDGGNKKGRVSTDEFDRLVGELVKKFKIVEDISIS